MASIVETVPGALSKEYMRSKLEVIDLDETITKEYAKKIVEMIGCAAENLDNLGSRGEMKKEKYIFIYIHCIGGSIYESFRIINAIERAKRYCVVGTIIDSVAFSAAVPIFCAGDDGFRFVSPYAQVMIHQPKEELHSPIHPLVRRSCLSSYSSPYHPMYPSSQETKTDERAENHLQCPRHVKRVHKQVIGAILNALKNKEKIHTKIFLHDLERNKDRDWFLEAKDMLKYGLADYASVPDFVHHVEYHPALILDGMKIEL